MSYVYIYVFALYSVPCIIDGADLPAQYRSSLISLTATPIIQVFTSHPGYDGHIRYPDGNYTQDWHITTNWNNHTIKIHFATCFIENFKGVCLSDNLYVFDGANANSLELLKTCCGKTHSATLESSTGEMYILFETDNTVGDIGFEIEYWSNGITTTTLTPTVTFSLVTNVSHQDTGLIKGELAGIVVGCIVGVVLIVVVGCVIIWKFVFNKRKYDLVPGIFTLHMVQNDIIDNISNAKISINNVCSQYDAMNGTERNQFHTRVFTDMVSTSMMNGRSV
ncbi:Hypothetical predicted protein [Mytilus galloprovincialis]|uniref:CUB domain-containing protein n=1 Tax=Mytilus galloprovincialis TaxID=29158 RepID=A0A8B6H2X1_MYTGA|nr:Hypothetical predicted protein [Mytilus galloprovincialis]